MTARSVLGTLREEYQRKICSGILGYRETKPRALNVADKDSLHSRRFAEAMVGAMAHPLCDQPPKGQTAGTLFAQYTKEFLEQAVSHLGHLRPGHWLFSVSQARPGIAQFEQYEHLAQLQELVDQRQDLAAALGGDYLVTPDIAVARQAVSDEEINREETFISGGEQIAQHAPLRAVNRERGEYILHASISCKWTMRSDRAQNTRTEALNLLRNRKGKSPHIVAVTFEPLPSRLASIAMGTGDVDCTYHGALDELLDGVRSCGTPAQIRELETLVDGRRLRDISDLPFDLAT